MEYAEGQPTAIATAIVIANTTVTATVTSVADPGAVVILIVIVIVIVVVVGTGDTASGPVPSSRGVARSPMTTVPSAQETRLGSRARNPARGPELGPVRSRLARYYLARSVGIGTELSRYTA